MAKREDFRDLASVLVLHRDYFTAEKFLNGRVLLALGLGNFLKESMISESKKLETIIGLTKGSN